MTTTEAGAPPGEIHVGIGRMAVVTVVEAKLVTHGLGSCVGLTAFDPRTRVGGMLHVMLPQRTPGSADDDSPCKYADTGVDELFEALRSLNANLRSLQLKAAGGACIVSVPGFGDRFKIGERNIEAVRAAVQRLGLKLAGEDMGGTIGRTMRMRMSDGLVTVQAIGQKPREL